MNYWLPPGKAIPCHLTCTRSLMQIPAANHVARHTRYIEEWQWVQCAPMASAPASPHPNPVEHLVGMRWRNNGSSQTKWMFAILPMFCSRSVYICLLNVSSVTLKGATNIVQSQVLIRPIKPSNSSSSDSILRVIWVRLTWVCCYHCREYGDLTRLWPTWTNCAVLCARPLPLLSN